MNELLIFCFLIAIRIFFSLSRKDAFHISGDGIAHLAILKYRDKLRIGYPTGFHTTSKIISGNLTEKYPGFFNIIIWIVFCYVLLFFGFLNNSTFLYLLLSCLLIDDYNCHQYGFSERLLAQLFSSFLIAIILYDLNILFSLLPISWLLFSSKFGRQFIIFVVTPFLIAESMITELALIALYIFLVISIFPHLRRTLKHHYFWSINYNSFSTIPQSVKNRPFYELHLLRIIIFPELLLILKIDVVLFVILLTLFFAFSLRKLSFLGESWRYIEWAIFLPIIIDGSQDFTNLLVLKILGFYLYQLIINIYSSNKNTLSKKNQDLKEISSKLINKKKIFTIPYRLGDSLMAMNPNFKLSIWWPKKGYQALAQTKGGNINYDKKYISESDWIVIDKTEINDQDKGYYGKVILKKPHFSNSTFSVIKKGS